MDSYDVVSGYVEELLQVQMFRDVPSGSLAWVDEAQHLLFLGFYQLARGGYYAPVPFVLAGAAGEEHGWFA